MSLRMILTVIFTLGVLCSSEAFNHNINIGKITIANKVEAYVTIITIPTFDIETGSIVRQALCLLPATCVVNIIQRLIKNKLNYNPKVNDYSMILDQNDMNKMMLSLPQISSSKKQIETFKQLLPQISDVIIRKDKPFTPILEIVYNGSAIMFTTLYPQFINQYDEAASTFPLSIYTCMPIIKANYMTRCSSYSIKQDIIVADKGDYLHYLDSKQLYERSNSDEWWCISHGSMLPISSIVDLNIEPIAVSNSFKDNFFSYLYINNYIIYMRGKNISLLIYNGLSLKEDVSIVLNMSFIKTNYNDYVIMRNKTSGKDISLLGYENRIEIRQFVKNKVISEDIEVYILEEIITSANNFKIGIEKVYKFLERYGTVIIGFLLLLLILFAVIYFLPIITIAERIISCFCKR